MCPGFLHSVMAGFRSDSLNRESQAELYLPLCSLRSHIALHAPASIILDGHKNHPGARRGEIDFIS